MSPEETPAEPLPQIEGIRAHETFCCITIFWWVVLSVVLFLVSVFALLASLVTFAATQNVPQTEGKQVSASTITILCGIFSFLTVFFLVMNYFCNRYQNGKPLFCCTLDHKSTAVELELGGKNGISPAPITNQPPRIRKNDSNDDLFPSPEPERRIEVEIVPQDNDRLENMPHQNVQVEVHRPMPSPVLRDPGYSDEPISEDTVSESIPSGTSSSLNEQNYPSSSTAESAAGNICAKCSAILEGQHFCTFEQSSEEAERMARSKQRELETAKQIEKRESEVILQPGQLDDLQSSGDIRRRRY